MRHGYGDERAKGDPIRKMVVHNIGSEKGGLLEVYFSEEHGTWVQRGCFYNSLSHFERQVHGVHSVGAPARIQYDALIDAMYAIAQTTYHPTPRRVGCCSDCTAEYDAEDKRQREKIASR